MKFVPQRASQPDTRGIATAARACKGVFLLLLLRYKCFVMLNSARRIRTRVFGVLFAFPWPPSVSLALLRVKSASAKVLLMWNECLSGSAGDRRFLQEMLCWMWAWPDARTLFTSLTASPWMCEVALRGRKQDTKSPSCSARSGHQGLMKKCCSLGVPGNGQLSLTGQTSCDGLY